METITFETLPQAAKEILEQIKFLSEKIDILKPKENEPDENRYVGIDEIRELIFPLYKKHTLYNKCYLNQIPHSRIGAKLMFHIKECREWRDDQIQKGKIKSQSQIEDEAQALFNSKNKIRNS
jgi:hypothetical protein